MILKCCVGTHLRVGQQSAYEISKRPVGPDTDVGQRRRGDGKQQVGHGEVEQEAIGDGAHLPIPEHGPGDGHVGHDRRGEYHHEHGHLDSRFGLLVAELRVEREKVPGTPTSRRVVAHQVRRVEQTHLVRQSRVVVVIFRPQTPPPLLLLADNQ